MTLLEELVRGTSLSKANKTTRMFAQMFQKMMSMANCLGHDKEMICDKLTEAFRKDEIDIAVLCSALGRQKLDNALRDINVYKDD